MGLETLTNAKQYGLTLVLGGGEVRPLDLAGAYSIFAADGIRKVSGVQRRLEEAMRLGFKRAFIPAGSEVKIAGMEIVEVSRIDQAISKVKI